MKILIITVLSSVTLMLLVSSSAVFGSLTKFFVQELRQKCIFFVSKAFLVNIY